MIERSNMSDINFMVRDAEVMVREALFDNLRHIPDVPHDVAMRLAQDVEAVSLPMLESSSAFSDQASDRHSQERFRAKAAAIAQREEVSEVLSEVIVTSAGEQAVASS